MLALRDGPLSRCVGVPSERSLNYRGILSNRPGYPRNGCNGGPKCDANATLRSTDNQQLESCQTLFDLG
jgi:hypothetical protein